MTASQPRARRVCAESVWLRLGLSPARHIIRFMSPDNDSQPPTGAFLCGGPANGRRFTPEAGALTNPLTVPAAMFGGYVDAVYVSTGTAHSTGGQPMRRSYEYVLPDGSRDPQRVNLDARERARRQAEGLPLTARREEDGLLNVWYADGPLAGRLMEVTASVIDGRGPDELGNADLPTLDGWYARANRLEALNDVVYEVYLHHPL